METLSPGARAGRLVLVVLGAAAALMLALYSLQETAILRGLMILAPVILAASLLTKRPRVGMMVAGLVGLVGIALYFILRTRLILLHGSLSAPFVRMPPLPPRFLVWVDAMVAVAGLFALLWHFLERRQRAAQRSPAEVEER